MPEKYFLKDCLVTGASGFVGRVLCEQLQNKDVKVRALLRQDQRGPWDERVLCDLVDFEKKSNEIFSDIDTIFYLASIAHDKAPADLYEIFNVQLCLRFAASALQHGVKRFVYVSSTKAMAEPRETIIDEYFLDWPKDSYGISKRKAEEGLLALAGFEHLVIIRPCLIYGKGVQGNLFSMLKLIDKGLFPPLPETGAKRSMVSVRDVASALILSATSAIAHRNIYLITDGENYSVKEIENAMRDALNTKRPCWAIPVTLLTVVAKMGDLIKKLWHRFPFTSVALDKLIGPACYTSEKIQRELGWKPIETFMQVLPEMVDDAFLKNTPE